MIPIRDEDERLPSGAMVRAARGLLGLESSELAAAVGVTRKTIYEIERDDVQRTDERRSKTLRKIRQFFADKNVVFLFADGGFGEGVRLSLTTADLA